mgnify:CR=1 FL=1
MKVVNNVDTVHHRYFSQNYYCFVYVILYVCASDSPSQWVCISVAATASGKR